MPLCIKKHISYPPVSKPVPVVKKKSSTRYYAYRSKEDCGKKWTENDDALLREMLGTTAIIFIAEKLGRKSSSVINRAARLGIYKRND